MKNTFGNSITMTIFGESHGSKIGVVIDGMSPGISVDESDITTALSKRRPQENIESSRVEPDNFEIVSGLFNGKTTGTPICILIKNDDKDSKAYSYGAARPSQADFTAYCKFHGFEDYRGSGHFSGRLTAPIVAAGAIFASALKKMDIEIGTHILSLGNEEDVSFSDISAELQTLKNTSFPVIDSKAEERMRKEIARAKDSLDSVGGRTETAVIGLPVGLGEPWFDSVESVISHLLFSIGGIKGVEFGDGFALCNMSGSEANDEFALDDNGVIITKTNHSGGINGGITNGMPVLFRCAIKPTSSIAKEQRTVNFIKNVETTISVNGRHDSSIVRRICPVIDAVTAFAVCDLLAQRYGTDVFLRGLEK